MPSEITFGYNACSQFKRHSQGSTGICENPGVTLRAVHVTTWLYLDDAMKRDVKAEEDCRNICMSCGQHVHFGYGAHNSSLHPDKH